MGKTTISKIEVDTCSAIWDKLLPTYLSEPTVDMWKSNSKDFYKNWNFPNCLGSIDGKHIRINQPQNSGSMYYNYKHFFSIQLLAVSDANYKFVMVDIELPNTNIKVPYTFIGDEAFPLLVNILRPYPGKQLINNNKKKKKVANISEGRKKGRRNNRFNTDARDTREIFADYFISEYGSVPWQMDYI
ncbi:uncharacterized protein LOC132943628 [Metopolophium dirhodum]|uniref:uncharacterized protein LOC132943628 n=1 Tax=Metopolophium dirhodum TaxID=44670 RepID=UPI00298FCA44|nr:uncharacterized protein LOC132943628 [Metopolophium dirhodum]